MLTIEQEHALPAISRVPSPDRHENGMKHSIRLLQLSIQIGIELVCRCGSWTDARPCQKIAG